MLSQLQLLDQLDPKIYWVLLPRQRVHPNREVDVIRQDIATRREQREHCLLQFDFKKPITAITGKTIKVFLQYCHLLGGVCSGTPRPLNRLQTGPCHQQSHELDR